MHEHVDIILACKGKVLCQVMELLLAIFCIQSPCVPKCARRCFLNVPTHGWPHSRKFLVIHCICSFLVEDSLTRSLLSLHMLQAGHKAAPWVLTGSLLSSCTWQTIKDHDISSLIVSLVSCMRCWWHCRWWAIGNFLGHNSYYRI